MTSIYNTGCFESAHLLKGHPKCGKLHGHSYKYEVWIASNVLLKPHYFVIDFHEIKKFFDTLDHSNKIITISCEKLAEDACEYFESLLKKSSIKVRIWETSTSYAEHQTA